MMTTDRELLERACKAIMSVYKTIGRPGDYGYDTPKGEALKFLYDVHNDIAAALDREPPAPSSAEAVQSSHPRGESDPVVTQDCASAETAPAASAPEVARNIERAWAEAGYMPVSEYVTRHGSDKNK